MKNGTAHVIGRASDEVHRCSIFSISWTAIDRVEIELIYLTAQRHVPSVWSMSLIINPYNNSLSR
jgi:hypothetical protein